MSAVERLGWSVWRVHAPGLTLKPYEGTQCYFVGTGEGMWLVDTGDGGPRAIHALETAWVELGAPPVSLVLITHGHRDHFGGAAPAHQHFRAPVGVHPADREAVRPECPDAVPFLPGSHHVGTVPVEVLHLPGHTPGQLNLWLPAERTLLAGDNVLGDTTSVVVPPAGDLHAYRTTLGQLEVLDPAVIGPGHGSVVRDPRGWLAYYREHRAERDRQVVDLLAEGALSVPELAAAIYGREQPHTYRAGQLMLLGHLTALEHDGVVAELSDGRYVLCEASK